jgi:hypothetical protein
VGAVGTPHLAVPQRTHTGCPKGRASGRLTCETSAPPGRAPGRRRCLACGAVDELGANVSHACRSLGGKVHVFVSCVCLCV